MWRPTTSLHWQEKIFRCFSSFSQSHLHLRRHLPSVALHEHTPFIRLQWNFHKYLPTCGLLSKRIVSRYIHESPGLKLKWEGDLFPSRGSVSQWPKWLRHQYGKLEICGSSPGYDTNFYLKNYQRWTCWWCMMPSTHLAKCDTVFYRL